MHTKTNVGITGMLATGLSVVEISESSDVYYHEIYDAPAWSSLQSLYGAPVIFALGRDRQRCKGHADEQHIFA